MEQFERQVVKYTDSTGAEGEGFVVGCEYDIGITIVNNANKDHYLYCLRGPSAYPELYSKDLDYEYYNELFENIVAMFKDGFFNSKITREIRNKYNESHDMSNGPENCAFNK